LIKPRMTSRYQSELFAQLEAILMVSDEPVTIEQLRSSLDRPTDELEVTLLAIQRDYDGETSGACRGFQLRHVAGGWRLYTRAEQEALIESYMLQGASQRLRQARLEAPAVIAYLQPATRS